MSTERHVGSRFERVVALITPVLDECRQGRGTLAGRRLAEEILDALMRLEDDETAAEDRTREALAMIDGIGEVERRVETALALCRAELERNKSIHSKATDGFALQVALVLTGGKP